MINCRDRNFYNRDFLFDTIYKYIHLIFISFSRDFQQKVQKFRGKCPKSGLSIRNSCSCSHLKNLSGDLVPHSGFPGNRLVKNPGTQDPGSGICSCPHQQLLHIFRQMLTVCVHYSYRSIFPQFRPDILKSCFYGFSFSFVFFMMKHNTFFLQFLKTFPVFFSTAVIHYQNLVFQLPKPVHQFFQAWLRIQSRYNHNIFHSQTLFLFISHTMVKDKAKEKRERY